MTGSQFKRRFTIRHRKSIAMAVAGWMSLSLVLAFWPCCQTVADDHPPVVGAETDAHHHDGEASRGTSDPCRTWLDITDAALNSSPDVLLSSFELKVGYAVYIVAHHFPAAVASTPSQHKYHPSPPASLPLYLLIQHLLI